MEHGGKLLPFLVSSTVFLVKYAGKPNIDTTYLVLKCLPLISLCIFVFLNDGVKQSKVYSRLILCGLAISALADVLIEK